MSWYLSMVSALVNLATISLAFTSSSLMMLWFTLELNLISFMGMLLFFYSKSSKSVAVKYFSFQVNISALFLFYVMMKDFAPSLLEAAVLAIMAAKIGMAPFHLWFISIMSKVQWPIFIWMAIPQKFIPLIIMSMVFPCSGFSVVMVASILLSLVHSLVQTKMKKVMAMSSVFSLNWIVLSSFSSGNTWIIFFLLYSFFSFLLVFLMAWVFSPSRSIHAINKVVTLISILLIMNLSGIPPSPMFFMKLSVLSDLMLVGPIFVAWILMTSSLVMLFMYMNMSLNLMVSSGRSTLNGTTTNSHFNSSHMILITSLLLSTLMVYNF